MRKDSLVVWFNRAGMVHIYSVLNPSVEPIRKFPVIAPRASAGNAQATVARDGLLRASSGPPFVPVGGPGAIDETGRLYLILHDQRDAGDETWPQEKLAIFDLEGSLISRFRLPTRNTRSIKVARDGSVLMLAHPSADVRETWTLLRAEPIFTADTESCRWLR